MRTICAGASVAAVLLFGVSCDLIKKKTTTPSPTVSSVSITSSTDFLKVNESATFTATAAHSDGSTATVNEWRSDTAAVATVDATTGKVTGVTAGVATIIAVHDGMIATKTVRVAPDFAGSWSGEFRVTSCSGIGAAAAICPHAASMPGAVALAFVQNREQVTGTMDYSYTFEGMRHPINGVPVTGTIDVGGHLRVSGSLTNSKRIVFVLRADGNDLYIQAGRVRGAFIVDMTVPLPGVPESHVSMGQTIWGDGLAK